MYGNQRCRNPDWTPPMGNSPRRNHSANNQVLVFDLPSEMYELMSYVQQFMGGKYSPKAADIAGRLTQRTAKVYAKIVYLNCSASTTSIRRKILLYGFSCKSLTKVISTSGNFYESVEDFKRYNNVPKSEKTSNGGPVDYATGVRLPMRSPTKPKLRLGEKMTSNEPLAKGAGGSGLPRSSGNQSNKRKPGLNVGRKMMTSDELSLNGSVGSGLPRSVTTQFNRRKPRPSLSVGGENMTSNKPSVKVVGGSGLPSRSSTQSNKGKPRPGLNVGCKMMNRDEPSLNGSVGSGLPRSVTTQFNRRKPRPSLNAGGEKVTSNEPPVKGVGGSGLPSSSGTQYNKRKPVLNVGSKMTSDEPSLNGSVGSELPRSVTTQLNRKEPGPNFNSQGKLCTLNHPKGVLLGSVSAQTGSQDEKLNSSTNRPSKVINSSDEPPVDGAEGCGLPSKSKRRKQWRTIGGKTLNSFGKFLVNKAESSRSEAVGNGLVILSSVAVGVDWFLEEDPKITDIEVGTALTELTYSLYSICKNWDSIFKVK